jgi:hypothetical protein
MYNYINKLLIKKLVPALGTGIANNLSINKMYYSLYYI